MYTFKKLTLAAVLIANALAGCGGGTTTASSSLGGTVAVGFAVVGGAVDVKCASAGTIAATTTSSSGALQVDLTGKTLPCAIEVTGGTINGVANTTAYHSIAMAIGNVNVTPLTDLLIANLAASTTPSAWYAALTPAALAAITSTQVSTATTNVKTALGLTTQLTGIDPITTVFTPTRNNVMDNTLEAIQSAITNNGNSHATLLGLAGASAGAAFTPPAGFNTALSTAYSSSSTGSAGSTSGGSSTAATVTSFSPSTGVVGTTFTITGTNLGLGFQPAPIVMFGTTAVSTALTFSGQTGISFAVPSSLAAGAYTVTIGGATGTPLTVGTFTVTAAPVTSTATGMTVAPAANGLTSFPNAVPAVSISGTDRTLTYKKASTTDDGFDYFDFGHAVVSGETYLSIDLRVGNAITINGSPATNFVSHTLFCTLIPAPTPSGTALCSTKGIVFDKAAGSVSMTNTPLTRSVVVNGSFSFTPF